jgi:hypothetical protein
LTVLGQVCRAGEVGPQWPVALVWLSRAES